MSSKTGSSITALIALSPSLTARRWPMVEQTCASQLVPARIPLYIGNLNALAVDAGLTVEMSVEPYNNSRDLRLWSNWRGAQAVFLALVQPVESYRLPLSCGRLNIPGGAGYYGRNSLISGDVTV